MGPLSTWLELVAAGAELVLDPPRVTARAQGAVAAALRGALAWRVTALAPQARAGRSSPEARPASERPHGKETVHVKREFVRGGRDAGWHTTVVKHRRPKYGTCLSCGDALAEHYLQYDCQLCKAAWIVALRDARKAVAA